MGGGWRYKIIAEHARENKRYVIQLLDYLQAMPYEDAHNIYSQILQKWNDRNVYELVDTGSSFIGYYEKDCYDF